MFDPVPPDIVIQRQVEEAIALGHPLPRWGWKTPVAYNSSTGAERIAGWQKVLIAERLGLLSRGGRCSVCHSASAEQFHSEVYLRSVAVRSVCRSCHYRVHRRFVDPNGWHVFLGGRARLGDWALCLRTFELDRQQAEQVASARDVFAALAEL